jgi:nucleoside-diphosphate-sugar epimerase
MNVLITGASGRLGPFVMRELIGAGHEFSVFDVNPPVAEFSDHPFVKGNINNLEDCRKAAATKKFDAVLHLAAQPWPTDHPKQAKRAADMGLPPGQTMQSNIMGTYNVLYAAVENKIGVLVMTGSNCASGLTFRLSNREFPLQYLPLDEDHPTDPEDSYSFSKLTAEKLLESYSKAHGIRTYALRSAGMMQEEARRKLAENAKPANAWMASLCSWVATEDVASAHRLVMEKAAQLPLHAVYFLNANDSSYLEPTMEIIKKYKPDFLDKLKGDLPGNASMISNRRLREAVGWEPKFTWRQYLKNCGCGCGR